MPQIHFPGKSSDFLKIGVAEAGRGDVPSVREILKARPKWIHRVGSHGRTMLWEASHRGKLEMVKYLVRRKADINACGSHYTPYFVDVSCYCIARFKKRDEVADFLLSKGATIGIHTAAYLGDHEEVRRLLKRKKSLVRQGFPQHEMGPEDGLEFVPTPTPWATPLCYALRGGDVETVELLIQKGSQINGFEKHFFIAANEKFDMVRLLLENGADPQFMPDVLPDEGSLFELATKYGKTAKSLADSDELVYLCRGDRGGNPDQVRRFLKQGADVNFQDHKGKTALHRAAKAGFIETMEILLEHGAIVDVEDHRGETALFDAVRSTIKNVANKRLAVKTLLKSGADPCHESSQGHSPLTVATKGKSADRSILRLLRGQK